MNLLGIFWYYKPANVYGGPVSAMSAMLEDLASNGADVTVLTTNANGRDRLDVPLNKPVNVNGVQVIYFPVTWDLFSVNYSNQLAVAISSRIDEFDLVISGMLWHPLLVDIIRTACLKSKVPYVVPLFGQLMPWALNQKSWKKRLFFSLFGKRYLNQASALQCTDPVEVNAVNQMGLSSPAILIPNSIDKSQYSDLPARGLFRRELEIREDEIVLLFLGRLHHVKRPEIVLEVLINIGRPDVHLIYAGPDEEGYKGQLQRRAQEMGHNIQVHFVGNLDRKGVLQAFSDSDLLVMPSEQENFGMSAAEALMSGLPVLTSKFVPVGARAAQIGAGRVTELSVEAFTGEMQNLLQHPEKLKEMGALGKEFAERNFDVEGTRKLIISQYTEIIARSRN